MIRGAADADQDEVDVQTIAFIKPTRIANAREFLLSGFEETE
jgi:hypothetical protein